MNPSIQKMHDFYAMKPNAPIYQEEFGFYCLEKWKEQGYLSDDTDINQLFHYDAPAKHSLGELGWCEAAFSPMFEEIILVVSGAYELVQDWAGRSVLYFKGRRNGFMPEYLDHPVKDRKTWEENVKWRLEPTTRERYATLSERMASAKQMQKEGLIICQNLIGGYMYLRSLMGPEGVLYMFYDDPGLIHDCMQTWFLLADAVIARHQEAVTLDEVFLAEDICYNTSSLISPDLIREFLFPYYQQLIINIKKRQKDKHKRLFLQVDTDGHCESVIPVYQELGLDYMSPFEVASGCDVVEIGKKYPNLLMRGGFDKRILAQGADAIDREIDRIMPFMKRRGGFIPTCDHGVPEEVSFENYMHYRKRMLEYAK